MTIYLITNQKHNLKIGQVFSNANNARRAMQYVLPNETLYLYAATVENAAIAEDGTVHTFGGNVVDVCEWNLIDSTAVQG